MFNQFLSQDVKIKMHLMVAEITNARLARSSHHEKILRKIPYFSIEMVISWKTLCITFKSFLWVKAFENRPSKICGRQPLKNLKWFGLNPSHVTGQSTCLLKIPENIWFSDVSRGYRKRPVAWNTLVILLHKQKILLVTSFLSFTGPSAKFKEKWCYRLQMI